MLGVGSRGGRRLFAYFEGGLKFFVGFQGGVFKFSQNFSNFKKNIIHLLRFKNTLKYIIIIFYWGDLKFFATSESDFI